MRMITSIPMDADAVPYASLPAWLDKFGMAGADRTLNISRSNLQMLWQGPHRWNFFIRSRFGPGDCGIELILLFLKRQQQWLPVPIAIPDDWKTSGGSLLDATLTAALTEYLNKQLHDYVEFKPRESISDIAYPHAKITLHEIRDPTLKIYDIRWMLFKLFSKCDADRYIGFHEHLPGSLFSFVLPSVCYQIPGCDVIRFTPIALPIYCAGFGSSVRLDFACTPSKCMLPNGLPGGFSPVLFAVDYVDSIPDLTRHEIEPDQPSEGSYAFPDRSHGIVKLAKIFEPALQLLVTYIVKKYQAPDGQWIPEWNPLRSEIPHLRPDLPEDLFFYAINHSKSDCMVYAFFPRYSVTPSGRVEWGFCCSEAYRLPSLIASASMRDRMRVVKTLLRVQRHTVRITEVFTELSRAYMAY
ncbi:hypothetical protein HETIRDRAFT_389963 [Heterobasidion irregulare TC 32-1]|uniref:Uncharacterized protein n=1 Tax=Heterobasidion irregulare (strain TC 32-1) TaxID=747525 RepID=W4JVR1_HETIT|nr:uncharacterized protein HETIRDRAFT_389963 [Heterobasidion irregulare TC 32-1]ETW76951.1 hypothetical protein HETIRDRAFT_389963 [Heterobasidion irregulare TC 32-1]